MLGDYPVHVVLLSRDLTETRAFYHDQLGLEIMDENEAAISFRCGGESVIAVTMSTVGTADEQTQAGWFVPDLSAEITELRSRGVEIQEYNTPDLRTVDGVADLGFALAAWIVDPHGNALGILQLKDCPFSVRRRNTPCRLLEVKELRWQGSAGSTRWVSARSCGIAGSAVSRSARSPGRSIERPRRSVARSASMAVSRRLSGGGAGWH